MREAHVVDWLEHSVHGNRWKGWKVTDRNGTVVAALEADFFRDSDTQERAHKIRDALNAGGAARERVKRALEEEHAAEPRRNGATAQGQGS